MQRNIPLSYGSFTQHSQWCWGLSKVLLGLSHVIIPIREKSHNVAHFVTCLSFCLLQSESLWLIRCSSSTCRGELRGVSVWEHRLTMAQSGVELHQRERRSDAGQGPRGKQYSIEHLEDKSVTLGWSPSCQSWAVLHAMLQMWLRRF